MKHKYLAKIFYTEFSSGRSEKIACEEVIYAENFFIAVIKAADTASSLGGWIMSVEMI